VENALAYLAGEVEVVSDDRRVQGAEVLVHQAILAGHAARFLTASELLLDLNGQETARALERRLRSYTKPSLVAIDEIGYLGYDAHAADLLFQVVSRRYEQRSLVVTTNLPFKQWNTVFPNASCAVALIDRLTHHAEIIPIEGESYRLREAELAQQARRAPAEGDDRKRPAKA
jgi:DNA replication protein DnaC